MMFILLSELVFSLGFSQSVFPSKGFLPLFFFPGGCWAIILLNSFLCVAPAHRCVVCVLSVLMTFWSGVHSKRLITYWSWCMFGMLVCCYML